jgi:methionyl aminopeptidase
MERMSIETQRDLDALRRAGRVVAETIAEARRRIHPGMSTAELDGIGENVFARHGARSAPRDAYGFPGCLCLSVNDEAVHGIPSERVLRAGDLVKVDVTAELDGYVADACESIPVGAVDRQTERLRAAADAALRRGIATASAGTRLREVGAAVERLVEARGFSVLRDLQGHGVGRAIHEPPEVPSWGAPWATERLTEGLVMTIEPIISAGGRAVVEDPTDGWTVRTRDGARSAHAEHTIVITRGQPLVLTAAA